MLEHLPFMPGTDETWICVVYELVVSTGQVFEAMVLSPIFEVLDDIIIQRILLSLLESSFHTIFS